MLDRPESAISEKFEPFLISVYAVVEEDLNMYGISSFDALTFYPSIIGDPFQEQRRRVLDYELRCLQNQQRLQPDQGNITSLMLQASTKMASLQSNSTTQAFVEAEILSQQLDNCNQFSLEEQYPVYTVVFHKLAGMDLQTHTIFVFEMKALNEVADLLQRTVRTLGILFPKPYKVACFEY